MLLVADSSALITLAACDALETHLVNQALEQAARTLRLSRNGLVLKMERLGLGGA